MLLLFNGFVFTVTIFLFLIGCGKEASDNQEITEIFREEFCRIPPHQKPEAFVSIWDEGYAYGPFEKLFFTPRLERYVQTSYFEVIDSLSELLSFYRIPEPDAPPFCNALYQVPKAPEHLNSVWGNTKQRLPNVAGIYFNACGFGELCDHENPFKPTIFLRDTATKWVAVHEYMHYNFDKSRRQSGQPSFAESEVQIQRLVAQIQPLIHEFREAKSPVLFNREILVLLSELTQAVKNQLRNKTFEEVAIEAMLIKLWADGYFHFVSDHSPDNGLRYIDQNLQEAQKVINEMTQLFEFLRGLLPENWYDQITQLEEEERKFNNYVKSASSFRTEAHQLIEHTRRSDFSNDFNLRFSKHPPIEETYNCSHNPAAQKAEETFIKSLRQLNQTL